MVRWICFAIALLGWAAPLHAQMSVDEAMERLREREAERAALAATQPAATEASYAIPQPTEDAPDLSLRVEALESQISGDFSGSIGAMWAPADTQQWLDNKATSAARSAMKLVGMEAEAKIIVESTSPSSGGVCVQGHLFAENQRLSLTSEDRLALKPEQDQVDADSDRLESLHAQLAQANAQMNIDQMQSVNSNPVFQFQDSEDQLKIQMQSIQSQIAATEYQLNQAKEHLSEGESQRLSEDRLLMQVWGPICVNTEDKSLRDNPPGSIISIRVRVTEVAVSVGRMPDGAGWEFASDAGDGGQTRMPTSADDLGSGPIAPSVDTSVRLICDDVAHPPGSAPLPGTVANAADANPSDHPMLAADHAAPVSPHPTGIISDPHDEAALAASVGFVVVGYQADLPSGQILQRPLFTGSCFAVTPDGYLLTNRHVVAPMDTLDDPALHDLIRQRWNIDYEPAAWVFFGKDQYHARVEYVSQKFDFAVLRVFRRGQIFFRLAAAPTDPRGSNVFAAGFPGLGSRPITDQELQIDMQSDDALSLTHDIKSQFKSRDFEYTLTTGAIGRTVEDSGGERWIQHEAIIRHGNSGGPLINDAGIALGINTRSQHDDEGDAQTNLSLEISQFRQELDEHVPGLVWASP